MPSSNFSSLTLRSEPSSGVYGPNTAAPAPAWLLDAVPGTGPLVEAFDDARQAARVAQDAHTKAIAAFRAASNPNSGSWEPRVDVGMDEWRQLKAAQGETELATRRTAHPVKAAWLALREHVIAAPEARAEANRAAEEGLNVSLAALDALDASLKTFAETDALVAHKYVYNDGLFRKALSSDLVKFSRDLREVLARSQRVAS